MTSAIKQMNPKKATGFDGLPPQILATACPFVTQPLTYICNSCISNRYFPDSVSLQMSHLFLKRLTIVSKITGQSVFYLQYSNFLRNLCNLNFKTFKMLSSNLSAFGPGHSFQSVLLKLTEVCSGLEMDLLVHWPLWTCPKPLIVFRIIY